MAHTDPYASTGRTRSARRRCNDPGCTLEPLEPRSLRDAALPLVVLSVAEPTCSEAGPQIGRFSITRFGNTDRPLAVRFQIAGSATPGVDYVGLSGMATIPAGRRSVSLPVVPIDDLEVEGGETVRVSLTPDAPVYRLDDTSALNRTRALTIKDNDVRPQVTLATPDQFAGEIGNDTATFTIRRTGATDLPLTVEFRIAGSATPGVDYEALPTSVTIQPGRRAAFLTVRVMNDALLEGAETVRVILQTPEDDRYTLKADEPTSVRRSVFIQDRPLVAMLITDPLATSFPADTAEFTIFRTGPTEAPLQVAYRLDGSAVMGTDYAQLPQIITIPAGQTFTRVIIRGLNADLTQQAKTVRMTLRPLATYNLNTDVPSTFQGTVTIIDDTVPPGT